MIFIEPYFYCDEINECVFYIRTVYQPSDKRSGSRERDRDHRDRGNGSNNNSASDRISRLCDWSEHVSSSGKKYYYNCKTEISQWEKPKEWLETEER